MRRGADGVLKCMNSDSGTYIKALLCISLRPTHQVHRLETMRRKEAASLGGRVTFIYSQAGVRQYLCQRLQRLQCSAEVLQLRDCTRDLYKQKSRKKSENNKTIKAEMPLGESL